MSLDLSAQISGSLSGWQCKSVVLLGNKWYFHSEPRQKIFPWKALWWNPCCIKPVFALRRRISVSACHNYLSVLAYLWNCFSSISKRISRKVLHSQCRGEKQRHYRRARAWDCLVYFSALYWVIADSKVVLFKFNLKKKKIAIIGKWKNTQDREWISGALIIKSCCQDVTQCSEIFINILFHSWLTHGVWLISGLFWWASSTGAIA